VAPSAYEPTLALQAKCEAILNAGWGQIEEYSFLRSILFFDLLHQVMRIVSTGKRSQWLRTFVATHWGGDPAPPNFPCHHHELESLGVADRHRILGLVSHIVEGWPWRFVEACSGSRMWNTWAIAGMKDQRFAYIDPISAHLKNPPVPWQKNR
jgi:hypothetical protein